MEQGLSDDLTQVLSGLHDAAILANGSLEPVWCNDPFLHLVGMRRRSFLRAQKHKSNCFALIGSPQLQEHAEDILESGRNLRLSDVEVQVNSAPWRDTEETGETLTVMVSMSSIQLTDGSAGILLTYRDVTAEVGLQERYKRMLEREQQRGDELEILVKERTAELEEALEEVRRLSRTDTLTGLWNRRAFCEHAEDAILMAERHDRYCAIMMVDLDHFKGLNDTHGHQAGDAMLVATAHALSTSVRETDRVGRYGGEEFIVILTELDAHHALAIAERCREHVEGLPFAAIVPGKTEAQTASIGLAVFPEHGANLDELVHSADAALYKAKEAGRNRVVVATVDSDECAA